jgi:hypothetical protein
MKETSRADKYTLGPSVRKLLAFATGFAVVGVYLALHTDAARPNLALIAGIGACSVALAIIVLILVWTYRSRSRARHPRVLEVSMYGSQPDKADCAVLEVSRPAVGATDFIRVYKVRVDGAIVSDLRIGDTCRISLRPGEHMVDVQVDQYGSAKVSVDLDKGSTERLVVAPTEGTLPERRAQYWLQLIPAATPERPN